MLSAMFKNPFSFHGRISRLEFFLSFTIFWVALSVAVLLDYVLNDNVIFVMILLPFLFWFLIAQYVKRLHDLDQSPWLLLLMAIPVINTGLVIYLLFWKGTSGRNQYGEPANAKLPQTSDNIGT